MRAPVLLLALALTGCALPAAPPGAATTPAAAPAARVGAPAPADPTRVVGRWEGEVDLTFPDRTLIVHAVRRQGGAWVAEAEYGTTGLYLTTVPARLETAGGRVTLTFVTQLASAVRLQLDDDDVLRGTFRLPNETQDRPIELRRAAAGTPARPPSTALERLSRAAAPRRAVAEAAAAAAPPAPPTLPVPADPAAALPPLLLGRWEGELDFAISRRVLVVDAARREGGAWAVQARFGVSDADLTPVSVLVETAGDRVVLRFVTSFASRVVLTLHADRSLRGTFQFAFEAKERRLELARVATAAPAGQPAPLTVAFRHPPDQARLGAAATVATAIVTSGKGVARVTLTLNGVEVHQETERGAPKSVVVSVPVALREGVNVLAITATEPDGAVRQEVRTVTYDRSLAATAAPAPAAPPAARERWAVVIGAGRYDSAAIPPLGYTVADAEAVHATLVGPGGFKPENVLLLTDTSERKPTLRNVRYALGTFLARAAHKDDTVLIFFAGHGAPETDLRGAERDGLAKYLIPLDADPDDLYATALPMDEIRTIFERIEAERVVAFFDTCYSGAAGGRTFASRKTRAVSLDDLFLERLTQAKGRVIVTASRPSEVSIELPELGHGIFTYYLVAGLRGAADANRDGIVTLQELYEYLAREVGRKSRAVGGNQHPVMKGELEGALPLVQVRQ
ncbi:MAG: hypothetical protein A3D33_20655 [Candidatus Rokubacteria bacterium RIFCSPHIGHO2_02_FULL_73_26]|nr:MAG: hypothetical protein A3D33_20655 [Candidatus Rokubacteria bacterium RIFCSPHIGHO2_02_FULL_73_26]